MFLFINVIGARYSLRQAQGPRMGGSGTAKKMGRSLAPLDLVKNNDIASR